MMATPAELLQALKQKEWIELSHSMNSEIPRFSMFSQGQFKTIFSHEDGFFAQENFFVGQYGTHIDAPVHFVKGQRCLNELDLKELAAPLYVIDAQAQVEKNADYELSVADILAFEQTHGVIAPQSFVAFCSGWCKRWPDKEAYGNVDAKGEAHVPGWSLEALKFLVDERQVIGIGHETLDTDSAAAYRKNGSLIAEYYIMEQGRYQVEVMNNLHLLPPKGAIIFNFAPRVDDSPGFPVRCFAVLP